MTKCRVEIRGTDPPLQISPSTDAYCEEMDLEENNLL